MKFEVAASHHLMVRGGPKIREKQVEIPSLPLPTYTSIHSWSALEQGTQVHLGPGTVANTL